MIPNPPERDKVEEAFDYWQSPGEKPTYYHEVAPLTPDPKPPKLATRTVWVGTLSLCCLFFLGPAAFTMGLIVLLKGQKDPTRRAPFHGWYGVVTGAVATIILLVVLGVSWLVWGTWHWLSDQSASFPTDNEGNLIVYKLEE